MAKSRNKDTESLLQEKVVDINSYRTIQSKREDLQFAIVSESKELYETLREHIGNKAIVQHFDSPFSFEKGLKETQFDVILLDERSTHEEALQLCEKLKRQSDGDEVSVLIVSDNNDKKRVRKGYETGCDEWITRLDDLPYLANLLVYYGNN